MNRKGFATLSIFIIIAAIIIVSLGYFLLKPSTPAPSQSTTEKQNALAQPSPTSIASTSSTAETSSWKVYSNPQYGFSVKYPPSLFVDNSPSNCSAIFCLKNTSKILVLGGPCYSTVEDINPSNCTTNGFLFIFDIKNHPGPFDVNSYLSTQYGNSEINKLSQISINGVVAYEFTVTGVAGAANPTIIVPHAGKLYEMFQTSYGTENTALFEQVASTFQFSP
jgi:hypothetical protein